MFSLPIFFFKEEKNNDEMSHLHQASEQESEGEEIGEHE
jgi:hypothetical protein